MCRSHIGGISKRTLAFFIIGLSTTLRKLFGTDQTTPRLSIGVKVELRSTNEILFKIWEGYEYCGEFIMDKGGQNFLRDYGGPDNLTDFLKVPIALERVYRF